jgi:hypothetical protein
MIVRSDKEAMDIKNRKKMKKYFKKKCRSGCFFSRADHQALRR